MTRKEEFFFMVYNDLLDDDFCVLLDTISLIMKDNGKEKD